MDSRTIRTQFIKFFKDKEHSFVRSSSVVPLDDPTLLFTNAGMNQFKPYFLGIEKPEISRAVNSQKCIRVSGKHNDLEEVGVDNFHHTFFEMLGNWSFGDYYKKEAISWAWELLTEVWKLDKNRLWVTVYKDDDESRQIWADNTDINPERILKFGNKDNFWEMGETGPCGPCTEIHYYTGDSLDNQNSKGVNIDEQYREIWNLVFIQYNRNTKGELEDLPDKHVDTGAGFERLVAILNNKESNYETDLFVPIIKEIEKVTNKNVLFNDGIPHQVIADHLRMLSFSIADGALPSNEGRGYVLRRVLRRAARYGRMLDMNSPFIFSLVDSLVEIMGEAYPELKDRKIHIEKVIKSEEQSFNETLDRGIEIFEKIVSQTDGKTIAGGDAFKLYDTYGFPLDLTELMAKERGYSVNNKEFDICMKNQKNKGRETNKFKASRSVNEWISISSKKSSFFMGYEDVKSASEIIKFRMQKDTLEIVLSKTPFYAESGGQISDTGLLTHAKFTLDVADVQKIGSDIVHFCKMKKEIKKNFSDIIKSDNTLDAVIDIDRRVQIRLNHTSTHLLHSALKQVLGDHVQQAGSLVAPEKLRFDLTHYEKIDNKQIKEIEDRVNDIIRQNIDLETTVETYDSAKKSGALALFGEKYEDKVRVVNIEGFSKELCGGTHANRTGDIAGFKIISEGSLSTGVRRIEAVTGSGYVEYVNRKLNILESLTDTLNCSDIELIQKTEVLISENKELENKINSFQSVADKEFFSKLLSKVDSSKGLNLIIEEIDNASDLRQFGDLFRSKVLKQGVLVIGVVKDNKPSVMSSVTDDMVDKINAIEIVQYIGSIINGGGGGKPILATAGGKDKTKLNKALKDVEKFIMDKVNNG